MSSIQELLSHVATIRRKNNEFLDATGGRFNMFRVLGVNHYENTHSAILAEFLNPKGSHGLKHEFLRLFVEGVLAEKEFSDFDFKNAILRTEANTPYGRIDILIEDRNGHAIIIENKIYADDQYEQLRRYDKHAGEKYGSKKYKVIYLTLSGTNASEHSCGEIEYLPISYKFHIIKWLEECVNISSRFPLVRETINQYINSLKQLTNQDMDTLNKNEIIDLLVKSPENIKSAMSIISNEWGVKKALIAKLYTDLEQLATKYGMGFKGDDEIWNIYRGFNFYIESWNNCCISFEFQIKNFRDMDFGISYIDKGHLGTISEETRIILNAKLNSKSTECWPAYKSVEKYKDWDNSTYVDIVSGKYQSYIEERIQEVLEGTNGIEL